MRNSSSWPTWPHTICRNLCAWFPATPSCWPNAIRDGWTATRTSSSPMRWMAPIAGLIQDLLAYSRVGKVQKELVEISSEAALQNALRNLSQVIAESGAVITHDPLPPLVIDEMH